MKLKMKVVGRFCWLILKTYFCNPKCETYAKSTLCRDMILILYWIWIFQFLLTKMSELQKWSFFSQGNIFCFIIIFLSVSFVSIVSSYIINYQVFGTRRGAYSLLEHKTSYILSSKLILLKRIEATISIWLQSNNKIIHICFIQNSKGIQYF